MILALAGGVGGARLANGLAAVLPEGELVVVVNTGDDFEHLGLAISPDIDTVTYTLAGKANAEQGWGIEGETWNCMAALEALGGPTWFRLGDRDLATHLERTRRLLAGESLSSITLDFTVRQGIRARIVPMCDAPVRTIVHTDEGVLAFQEYFVRRRCAPRLSAVSFEGVEQAVPSPGFLAALEDPALEAIVVCPSNPLLSIAPILALPGIAARIAGLAVPRIAVSPFVGGEAVKGPAAKILRELGDTPSAAALARRYGAAITGLVVDSAAEARAVASACPGLAVAVTDTLMRDAAGQARLAREVLAFARTH